MEKICSIMRGQKPAMAMVLVQIANAALNVLYKLAANDGMSLRILVAYRFIFAAAFMLPLALYFERKKRPKLTWVVVFQAFLCGLLGGSVAQNLYAKVLVLTSATFASAMTNLIPAFTFILAICFRIERLGLGEMAGRAKVVGTVIGIGGAMLLTLYKGVEINIWSTGIDLLNTERTQSSVQGTGSQSEAQNMVLGGVLSVIACFSSALSMICQSKMSVRYPCHYTSTALIALMGAIQGSLFALCTESDWSQWKLGWDIRLLSSLYSGIIASGVVYILIMWCVRIKGPLYVSIFSPLMLVLTAIAGSLLLKEKLHLGSVIGAVLIICGLYVVLWGKGKETKRLNQVVPLENSETIEIVVSSPQDKNTDGNSCSNNNKDNSNNITVVAPPNSDALEEKNTISSEE